MYCVFSLTKYIFKYRTELILGESMNFVLHSGKPQKSYFFSGPNTKALTSSRNFFLSFIKSSFSLVVRPLPAPPLLMVRPLKKYFFCGFPYTHSTIQLCTENLIKNNYLSYCLAQILYVHLSISVCLNVSFLFSKLLRFYGQFVLIILVFTWPSRAVLM